MPIGGSVVGFREIGYTGPGDVVANATAWWGLRAYSNDTIGTNAIRLRRDSDDAEDDFVTMSGGGLNISAITSFKGAANLFVVTLYEQAGTGFNLTQSTVENQPIFTLSGLGSHPVMTFVKASGLYLTTATFTAITQPYSFSTVMTHDNNGNQFVFRDEGASAVTMRAGDSTLHIFGLGAALGATSSNDTFEAVAALFNGVSSSVVINGTPTNGDAGTDNLTTSAKTLASFTGGPTTFGLTGEIQEFGVWSGNKSASFGDISDNQMGFWGF